MDMGGIYKKIAKDYDFTVEERKLDMYETINIIYTQPNTYTDCVPRKNDVPTIEEFVEHVSTSVSAFYKQ